MSHYTNTKGNLAMVFGWWRRAFLWLLLLVVTLTTTGVDSIHLTPAAIVGADHRFSLFRWEVENAPDKWINILLEVVSRDVPSAEIRRQDLHSYLKFSRLARKEKDRLEGLVSDTSDTGDDTSVRIAAQEYLEELLSTKNSLRPSAEEDTPSTAWTRQLQSSEIMDSFTRVH